MARGAVRNTGAVSDLRLLVNDAVFAVRAALLCQRNGQLLVEAGDYPFRNLPGGALHTGETLAQGAAREWLEETGVPAGPLALAGLVENFFTLKGRRWHELGVYYHVPAPDALPVTAFRVADQAANHLEWTDPHAESGTPIYPTAALPLLGVPEGEFRHVIHHEGASVPGPDLRLDVHGTEVQVRVHLLFVQDGHLLTNTVPGSGFWFLPGGSVQLHEDSRSAAHREFFEETGVPAASARLVGLIEGFDPARGRQQLGLCYLVEATGQLPSEGSRVRDAGQLAFQWVPLETLEARPVHPRGLSGLLDVPAGRVGHLVEEWPVRPG